jgi:hypothetical protein
MLKTLGTFQSAVGFNLKALAPMASVMQNSPQTGCSKYLELIFVYSNTV